MRLFVSQRLIRPPTLRFFVASGAVLVLLLGACQSPAPPPGEEETIQEAIDAYHAYQRGDCERARAIMRSTSVDSWAPNELRHSVQLITGFCSELDGDLDGARDAYRSLVRNAPLSFAAQDAADRLVILRQLENDPEYKDWVAAARVRAEQVTPSREAVDRVAAEFPPLAKRANIEGYAVVEFGITPRGDTDSPIVVDSNPPLLFDGVAVRAVREWRYERGPMQKQNPRQAIRLIFQPEGAAESESADPADPASPPG